MQHALRPYVTAGVALMGAGMVAITPVAAPSLPGLHAPDVALTADLDFTGAWTEVFDTAKANFTEIEDAAKVPGVALQQLIANQIGFIKGLSDGSLKFDDVLGDLKDQAHNVFEDTTLQGVTVDLGGSSMPDSVTHANDAMHTLIMAFAPTFMPDDMTDDTKELVGQLVNFLASPLSGVLIGQLGPSIAPVVALFNDLNGINDALSGDAPDTDAALQGLINIPAHMLGGLLNGATLDLDGLLPLIEKAGVLPEGVEISNLSFAFGGLLSPGSTALEGGGTEVGTDTGIGGSILNSLGLTAMGLPADGNALGPLAALENLDQIIASALGWDGAGSPLADVFGDVSL